MSAEANAGARLSSFRDVLGELEQAWYTVTHLLEVRREELRLAEMIHKFSFDTFDLEAWISERELYLQSISEPTVSSLIIRPPYSTNFIILFMVSIF